MNKLHTYVMWFTLQSEGRQEVITDMKNTHFYREGNFGTQDKTEKWRVRPLNQSFSVDVVL